MNFFKSVQIIAPILFKSYPTMAQILFKSDPIIATALFKSDQIQNYLVYFLSTNSCNSKFHILKFCGELKKNSNFRIADKKISENV